MLTITLVLGIPGVVGAEEGEEGGDEGTTVNVPGTGAGVVVHGHGVGIRTPDTPLESQDVTSPVDDVPVNSDPVRSFSSCETEEELGSEDIVPCEIDETLDLVSPCEDARRIVGEIPHAGSTLGSTYDDTLRTIDDTVGSENVSSALETVGVENFTWDDRASRAGQDCETSTPPTAVDGGGSGVLYTVIIDGHRVCPFGPSGVVCVDEEESTLGDEIDEEGKRVPAAQGCTFDRARTDCGTVDTPIGNVDPFATSNEAVNDSALDDPATTGPVGVTNTSTPRIPGVSWVVPLGSAVTCTTPGYASYENATTILPVVPQVTPTYEGEALPLGLDEHVSGAFAVIANKSAEAKDKAISAWNENTPGVVNATEDTWLASTGAAGLGQGEGNPGDGGCATNPGGSPQVDDPDGVLAAPEGGG